MGALTLEQSHWEGSWGGFGESDRSPSQHARGATGEATKLGVRVDEQDGPGANGEPSRPKVRDAEELAERGLRRVAKSGARSLVRSSSGQDSTLVWAAQAAWR